MAERADQRAAEGEAFIAGDENAVVRVMAAAVEQESLRYNPIVLCGPTGAGKSTVARALVARRRRRFGSAQMIETTGADLARSLGHAVEVRATDDFRARHQRCDVLLIDDCQAIAGKPAAQQFLVATIDTLVRRGSLVVVTMQQTPLAVRKLSPALASRLTAGLVVTLAHPGLAARCELVRRASEQVQLSLDDDDIERLASGRGRSAERFLTAGKLRAAVFELAANGRTPRQTVNAKDPSKSPEAEQVDARAVCRQVCNLAARQFGLTAGEIRGRSRCKSVAEARAVAMYVSRELTGASYGKIGKQFGGRDHTTVLHACKKVASEIEQDSMARRLTEELARQIAEA